MPTKIPIGVQLIGGLLMVIGGLGSLLILLEMIDSIRFLGMDSIFIVGYTSLGGFLLYGGIPVIFYLTGMGLLMSKWWARISALTLVPIWLFALLINMTCNSLREQFQAYHLSFFDLLTHFPEVFTNVGLRYCLFIFPLIFYLTRPPIRRFFYIS